MKNTLSVLQRRRWNPETVAAAAVRHRRPVSPSPKNYLFWKPVKPSLRKQTFFLSKNSNKA